LRGQRRGVDVAVELGWSESKLSRIETARIGISEPDLDRLLATYGLPAEDRIRLRDLARRGRARVWWTPYRSSVPDPYDEYLALEAEAAAMAEWEAQLIPGLLQTDEYARAVIEVGADIVSPETIQRRLALRMARQVVLTRDSPPQFSVVLDESVLRREVGGREVLDRQLQHLFDASHWSGVELLVLPFTVGAHAALTESFVIFDFEIDTRAPVVHSEGLTGGQFRTGIDDLRVYRSAFADLRRLALPVEATRSVIARSSDAPS
jgi:Domain of unknown function (DUF5753)/Helix-turn-helix domain